MPPRVTVVVAPGSERRAVSGLEPEGRHAPFVPWCLSAPGCLIPRCHRASGQHRGQLKAEPDPDAPPLSELIELMHAVWPAKKIIELVCSDTLAEAAQDYTLELNRASRELSPKGTGRRSPSFSDRERQLRAEFLEAARREMATRASRSCDAPIPRPTSLKRAHRQASTLEPAW
jgi:hypothetical protein